MIFSAGDLYPQRTCARLNYATTRSTSPICRDDPGLALRRAA